MIIMKKSYEFDQITGNIINPSAYRMLDKSNFGKNFLQGVVGEIKPCEKIIHLHACRQGPFLSNEIFLSIEERKRNPKLKEIIGIVHPFGLVSKYISYWFSGLQKELAEKMLTEIVLNGKNIYSKQVLDFELLNSPASEVTIKWDNLVLAFLTPLFDYFKTEFENCGFYEESLDTIKKIHAGKILTLEVGLIEASKEMVNMLLKEKGLPEIKAVYLPSKSTLNTKKKFINKDIFNSNFLRILDCLKNRNSQAYAEILKKIREYNNKFPNEELFKKIYSNLEKKKNKACSRVKVEYYFFRDYVKVRQQNYNYLSFDDLLSASQEAFCNSISKNRLGNDDLVYIDGEEMISNCFEYAIKNKICLVLQELMRIADYSQYKNLINKNPKNDFACSSCCIWNTDIFPEFDYNLVKGLKYLQNQ